MKKEGVTREGMRGGRGDKGGDEEGVTREGMRKG